MTDVKCSERVDRGDSRWPHYEPCGRDAVDGTDPSLCKLHLRVEERRVERDHARAPRLWLGDDEPP